MVSFLGKQWFSVLALILCTSLSACSPNVQTRGHVQDPDWKERIRAGQTTQSEVEAMLGSPSTKSSFGEDTWYYITSRRESFAFFRPEIAEQKVLRVTFAMDGTVSDIQEIDDSNTRNFDVAARTTPTEGHQLTFFEQLVGNVGRFNTPNDGKTGVGSNRPGGR